MGLLGWFFGNDSAGTKIVTRGKNKARCIGRVLRHQSSNCYDCVIYYNGLIAIGSISGWRNLSGKEYGHEERMHFCSVEAASKMKEQAGLLNIPLLKMSDLFCSEKLQEIIENKGESK